MSLQFIKLDDSDTGMLLVWPILSSALVWPMKGRPYFMFSTHVVDFLEARQKFAASDHCIGCHFYCIKKW